MITTFEAGAVFKIVNEASPVIREISRDVAKLDKNVTALRLNLEKIGAIKFGVVNAELKALNDTFVTMRPELSGVSRQLGLVDRRLGTLSATASTSRGALAGTFSAMSAGTNAALADLRALNTEWRELALSMRAATRTMPAARMLPAPAGRGGSGGRGGGFHVSSMGMPLPGGLHARYHGGNHAAMAALGAIAYGVYQESEVEDIAARAMITGQIHVDSGMRNSDAFKHLRDIIASTSTQTGFSPKQVGEAILTTERQFGGLDFMKRLQIEKTLLPFAAAEARLKETSLPEAFESLVGLMHMTGTFNPDQLPELARAFAYTSMITPASLPRFRNALSYSMPILHAGMNMDPQAVMFLTAMTQTAGITNTKSGTWIRSFFERLMPDTSGTKHALEHNRLLRNIHLLDANNQPTWFQKDAAGHIDWMGSLGILSGDMSRELARIPDTERLGVMKQIWGERGGGFGALMNLPQFVDQLSVLADKMKGFKGGENVLDQLLSGSPVQKARNAFADLQVVLMDIGSIALPPVVNALGLVDSALKTIDKFLPKPGTKGGNAISGLSTGAVAGFGLGKLVGMPWLGAGIGAYTGGTYEESGTPGLVGSLLGLAIGNPAIGAKVGSYLWSKLTSSKNDISIQPGKAVLNIDGRQIAEAIIPFIAKAAAGPAQGAPYHDSTYSTAPVDLVGP